MAECTSMVEEIQVFLNCSCLITVFGNFLLNLNFTIRFVDYRFTPFFIKLVFSFGKGILVICILLLYRIPSLVVVFLTKYFRIEHICHIEGSTSIKYNYTMLGYESLLSLRVLTYILN